MASLRDLYPELLMNVKGCPEPSLDDALIRAARTFAVETWLLRRTQAIVCTPNVSTYELTPPENEAVIAVKHVQLAELGAGNTIVPLAFVYGTTINPNITPAQPYGYTLIAYSAIVLTSTPDQAYPVTIELITCPKYGTQDIPDEMVVKYDRALGHGALEHLYRMRSSPWYDPQEAERHRQLFNQELIKGRIEAAYDRGPNQLSWLNPGFKAGGRRRG